MTNSKNGIRLDFLLNENLALHKRIAELEKKLEYLSKHSTLARGLAGEKLISNLIGGMLTAHTASSDVNLRDGTKIEVKASKISRGNKNYESGRRWQWQKIFGETNEKIYHYLILVGDADPLYVARYKDPTSPFVIFVIPRLDVASLTTAGTRGARGILLSTNPSNTRGKATVMYELFQRTTAEMSAQFGL